MLEFFKTIIYQPLYNLLMVIIDFMPGGDVGVAVVVITLLVRFVIFPLSKKSIITQRKMRDHQDELKELREKYKNNQQELAQKMMDFYKEKGIKPFSSFLLVLVQIPVIISLYLIFLNADLPEIQTDLLYSFISKPEVVNMTIFGLFDISQRSIILAGLAGLASFFHMRLSLPKVKPVKNPTFKDDFTRSMNMQMKFVFPVIIFMVGYSLSAVVALYLMVSNLFTLGQEVFVKRKLLNTEPINKEVK